MSEALARHRTHEPFDEGVRQRDVRYRFALVQLQNPETGLPSMKFKQRMMIGTDASEYSCAHDHQLDPRAAKVWISTLELDDREDKVSGESLRFRLAFRFRCEQHPIRTANQTVMTASAPGLPTASSRSCEAACGSGSMTDEAYGAAGERGPTRSDGTPRP